MSTYLTCLLLSCPWPGGLAKIHEFVQKPMSTAWWVGTKATRLFKNPQRFYREPASGTVSDNSARQRSLQVYTYKRTGPLNWCLVGPSGLTSRGLAGLVMVQEWTCRDFPNTCRWERGIDVNANLTHFFPPPSNITVPSNSVWQVYKQASNLWSLSVPDQE